MKHNLFIVAMLMIASTIFAQNPDGLTCETAIPVDTSYTGTIPAAGTYYYLASTYDLPLTCYYYPLSDVSEAPNVYVDFTCTPGKYEDPNVHEMISSAEGWGVEVPIKFTCTRYLDDNNLPYYALSISESYRELMTSFDITYNIDAIVAFEAPAAGKVMLRPDTTFKACAENSDWLDLPSTMKVGVGHEFDSYAWPLMEWKNDSIRFRWTGTTSPVTVWVGKTCDFDFSLQDEDVLEKFVLNVDAGNGENIRNFNKQQILDFISDYARGGVYYLRAVSSEDAELIVEKKPMSAEMQKAIPIKLNEKTAVVANATEQVYYFSSDWKKYSILWESSAASVVKAYFSSSVNFTAADTDEHIIDVYTFQLKEQGTELLLSKAQMAAICQKVSGDHVFVKFVADQATSITPVAWNLGACAESADEIYSNDKVTLPRSSTSTAWRINIEQWAKQDVKLYWTGTSSVKMYLADTCTGFALSQSNTHVKFYKEVTVNINGVSDTLTLTANDLQNLVQYADADGYLYFRFNNRSVGTLQTIQELTIEPLSPCVLASTLLEPKAELVLNLDKAFDIYRIDYQAWLASGVKPVWTGASPLHTFVAKDCEFAVAIYHKDVVNYTEVPAEGNVILSKDILATLGQYVDEDGYLYIRFLTELEGALTTQLAE